MSLFLSFDELHTLVKFLTALRSNLAPTLVTPASNTSQQKRQKMNETNIQFRNIFQIIHHQ